MKIRWSIVLLAGFGIVAALAAALLAASVGAQRIQAAVPEEETQVSVLVASLDLKPMMRLTEETIKSEQIAKEHAPESYYSEPSQLIGKVVSLPLSTGQPFTPDLFPNDVTGLMLAATLEPGKRAVNVSLKNYAGLEGLLYPGCRVDVLVYFKFSGNVKVADALSTTLLENVQVLGVDNLTVVSKSQPSEETERKNNNIRRGLQVTLLVDSKQAEALQLAMEHGTISLSMRNPTDSELVQGDATLLSGGVLAQLGELMGTSVLGTSDVGQVALEDGTKGTEVRTQAQARAAQFWTIDVIRGIESNTRAFPISN